MRISKTGVMVLGVILSNFVFAENDNTWRPIGTLSGGPAWSAPGKTQTIDVQPGLPETFSANTATQIFADGEIFLGLQHSLAHHLQGQLGIAAAGTTAISLNGDIWQDANPNFNNLSYTYNIKHTHVALKGKLLADIYQSAQPYISGSIGIGFNQAYQYSNTSNLFEVLAEPPFAAQTTHTLTYTLGAGLQKMLNTHWAIGVGYEFADWGKTSLAAATGQSSNSGLNLNHVFTNELQFSFSFVV